MRVLHVADLHVHDRATLDILEDVFASATARDVDLITIGGDLLDRSADLPALLPDVIARFIAAERPCLLVAGNHDDPRLLASLADLEHCTVLAEKPFREVTVAETTVLGVPYQDRFANAIYRRSTQGEPPDLALVHCALFYGIADAVPTEAGVLPHAFSALACPLVLGGHVHVPRVTCFDGGVFLYPGPPTATGWGPLEIDLDGGTVSRLRAGCPPEPVTTIPLDR